MDTETHELIAAYALDALDDAERIRVEQLLATSEEARAELRSFEDVAAALAVGVTGPEPAASLRERIVAEARADGVVVPFERPAPRALVPLLSLAAAAALILAIGLGAWAHSLDGRLGDTRSALEQQRQAAAVLADPSASSVALAKGSGRLVVDESGRAVLVVDDLAAAPSGRTYQVWVVEGGTPRSAGLFDGADGPVLVAADVPAGAVVAVTEERAGGATAPTSAPIVASRPV